MIKLSIIYFQEANEIRKIKGEIISDIDGFITLETTKRKFEINKKYIIKIESVLENGNKNEGVKYG